MAFKKKGTKQVAVGSVSAPVLVPRDMLPVD